MLLANLLSGNESSKIVLLQDSVDVSARPLLCHFIKSLLSRVDAVFIVVFEIPPANILDIFHQDSKSRIQIIDGFSDPLQWDSSERHQHLAQINNSSKVVSTVQNLITEKSATSQSHDALFKTAIVIDSLSHLALSSASQTCQILHQLSRDQTSYQVEQVVGLIHKDLHDNHVLTAVGSVGSSILHVIKDNPQGDLKTTCKILHKRKTGKVIKKKQLFDISEAIELIESDENDWNSKTNDAQTENLPEKMVDPTSNLTFNLKLTRDEEQARANTQLPFMHHTKTPIIAGHRDPESQIFYQPDEADDFDEDDPDDDLDI